MVPQGKIDQVRRLLAEGLYSQRDVARILKISRGTVGAIASGGRGDYRVVSFKAGAIRTDLPPVRCPGCGGWVYVPCHLCRIRKLLLAQPPSNGRKSA